jgi:UDP-N-acetylmuramate: L-alanyl-gamma-D-glutamyl-meso-diaminopimelate ligase
VAADIGPDTVVSSDIEALVDRLVSDLHSGDDVVIMSNGGFGGIHARLLDALSRNAGS